MHQWNQEFVASSREGQRYEQLAHEIDRALRFMKACGFDTEDEPKLHEVDFYTSHEALLLGYEEALTRQDSLTGDWYDCSAHMLWIGERTRDLDGAHVEFLAGVGNPIGVSWDRRPRRRRPSPCASASTPSRIPGRLTLITRLGADVVADALPPAAAGGRAMPATRWCGAAIPCTATPSPRVEAARPVTSTPSSDEIAGFFDAHRAEGTTPGGVHVELTGDDVTECLGGAEEIIDADLDSDRYETMCDPRLNARQSLDLAFRVAELLRG